MMRYIAFVSLFLFGLQLSYATEELKLEDDSLINKYFTSNEIESLRLILNFYEGQILQKCPENKSITSCYLKYLETLKRRDEKCMCIDLRIDSLQELAFIESITDGIFSEIWLFREAYILPDSIKIREMEIRIGGKYMDFLKEASASDTMIQNFYEDYMACYNVLCPSIVVFMEQEYSKFNFESDRIRLLFAVYYLAVNLTI